MFPALPCTAWFAWCRFYFGILRTEARRTSRAISADGSVAAAMAAAAAADTSRRRSSTGQAAAASDAADAGSTYDSLSPLPSGTVSPARITTTAASALPSRGPSHPQPQESRASMDSDRSHSHLPAFKRAMPSAFTDVRLGPLIGRGAYGRVGALGLLGVAGGWAAGAWVAGAADA